MQATGVHARPAFLHLFVPECHFPKCDGNPQLKCEHHSGIIGCVERSRGRLLGPPDWVQRSRDRLLRPWSAGSQQV